jgi:hypothetical protein
VRKALCSIGSGPHEALLAVSEPTFRAYAERHGYELITSTAAHPDRPPAWAKVPLIRSTLDDYDLVLWIDADAVIVDAAEDIAGALAPAAQLGLVQHRRDAELIPNTGVMVWRSGEFARSLLDRMWGATQYLDHPWWENAALLDALGYAVPRFTRLDRLRRRRLRARPAPPELSRPRRGPAHRPLPRRARGAAAARHAGRAGRRAALAADSTSHLGGPPPSYSTGRVSSYRPVRPVRQHSIGTATTPPPPPGSSSPA